MKRWLTLIALLLGFIYNLSAQQNEGLWMWYPTDFEIWLSNQVQNRRTERNAFVPPFWRVYSHNPHVNFTKEVDLKEAEEISIYVEGKYNITINSNYVQGPIDKLTIPAGKQRINIQVVNELSPPTVLIKGKTIKSDNTWTVSTIRFNSAENSSANLVHNADTWTFSSPDNSPSSYRLSTLEKAPANIERKGNSLLIDFGQETFGYLRFKNISGKGNIEVFYGESLEEAMSEDSCETLDRFAIAENSPNFTSPTARAYRFVNIKPAPKVSIGEVDMLYEYLPVNYRGTFTSSDDQMNKIWNVSAYTLHLSTREFFLDGIKRDRWLWSGDANQSYLMNYYLFFDNPVVKRTIRALRGGDPVEAHINTILDYSFYWFMSIYDYYLYSGDEELLRQMYPKMITLMDFCLQRRNQRGLVEGLPGDWVFLDWAPISKEGELSAIQLLFCRGLETMALCANLMNDETRALQYENLAKEVRGKIMNTFWDDSQQAIIHSSKNGAMDKQVTRYGNMFAILFDYLDSAKIEAVKKNVMLNDNVLKITTPYMRFYELEALCAIGQQDMVTKEIKSYWGGMLNEGATSFWELYDPNEKGAQRYAMYGRPFGKSLCHAWGASPIYLLGKYYLGVKPVKPGYEEYVINPNLGGLKWIEGSVPTPQGDIKVYMNEKQIKVTTAEGKGTLRIKSSKTPSVKNAKVIKKNKLSYEIELEAHKEYVVQYTQAR